MKTVDPKIEELTLIWNHKYSKLTIKEMFSTVFCFLSFHLCSLSHKTVAELRRFQYPKENPHISLAVERPHEN